MLESYFFIPADREDFLNKIPEIKADHFIIDFEDSVAHSEFEDSLNNLSTHFNLKEYYVRPNLWLNQKFTTDSLRKLVAKGVKKVVLPKIKTLAQVKEIFKVGNFSKVILLVETPDLLLALPKVIEEYDSYIDGIGFGSQDFGMYTNINQSNSYMNHVRFQINLIASKFEKKFIDTASMLIEKTDEFEQECINAFNMGCSGKFLIHPKQLNVLNSAEYYSDAEISWAQKALNKIGNKAVEEVKAYKIDGMVLEKPHLQKIKKIQKYLESK